MTSLSCLIHYAVLTRSLEMHFLLLHSALSIDAHRIDSEREYFIGLGGWL